MARPVAVYNACVLYPFYLRDLLVRLALADLVAARWTDEIHDEWIRNLSGGQGIPVEQLTRTRRLMDGAVPDCLVTDYQKHIPNLQLPDDRHVLAAAIECAADAIVTLNLDDFPQSYLTQFGVEAVHPDEFVLLSLGEEPAAVVRAMREQRAAYRDPKLSAEELIEAFDRCNLHQTAERLRSAHIAEL